MGKMVPVPIIVVQKRQHTSQRSIVADRGASEVYKSTIFYRIK